MNKFLAATAAVLSGVAVLLAMQSQTFIRVDAGGPKLRMLIAGNGSPTVVLDTGGEGSLELWGTVPAEVSKFTKTIAFDRAGNGLSDKPTTPRDGRNIAAELHTALRNANARPPYVLVGHSIGGPYIRVFAACIRMTLQAWC
jgi:pimeloyl-ACP methyl ester carboxylesterase